MTAGQEIAIVHYGQAPWWASMMQVSQVCKVHIRIVKNNKLKGEKLPRT